MAPTTPSSRSTAEGNLQVLSESRRQHLGPLQGKGVEKRFGQRCFSQKPAEGEAVNESGCRGEFDD
jgi:hypothetical protein